jgi:carbamoyltransferase
LITLGIHDGHNATAALMVDGRIVACVSEERFSRLKNDSGYPLRAVEYCLGAAGISGSDLDRVCFATVAQDPFQMKYKLQAKMSIPDQLSEERDYWRPLLYEGKGSKSDFLRKLVKQDKFQNIEHFYDFDGVDFDPKRDVIKMRDIRSEGARRHLGVREEQIAFYDHHRSHAAYAYYGSPLREVGTLALTLDGGGDATTSTVFQAEREGLIERARGNDVHQGRIYRSMTLQFGMKSGEHEYKLMGLAPYANEREAARSYEVFKDKFSISGDLIRFTNGKPSDLFFYYREAFEGHRFDGIAAATQRMVEDTILAWMKHCTDKFGSRKLVFGGGVAMNVKLNMLAADAPFLDDYFVTASPADESLAVGALYLCEEEARLADGKDPHEIEPFDDIYMGPAPPEENIENLAAKHGLTDECEIIHGATAADVATALAEGQVVARCAGRMEFGARSLGNRSILADPRSPDVVSRINHKIKQRDFWMPFAPVVKAKRAGDYLKSHEATSFRSPHMMIGYETTEKGELDLRGGLHPSDKTARPQILERQANPEYYDILDEFERLTGVGGTINTSFNMHGEPIVHTAEDAIHTFARTGLDAVVINNTMVRRRRNG